MKNLRQRIVGAVAAMLGIRDKVILNHELTVEVTKQENNYRFWTKDDDQYLLNHWKDSIESLALVLDRTHGSIASRRHRLKHKKV
jgi:predicted ribosome-associated RNA-binding protein Tma20